MAIVPCVSFDPHWLRKADARRRLAPWLGHSGATKRVWVFYAAPAFGETVLQPPASAGGTVRAQPGSRLGCRERVALIRRQAFRLRQAQLLAHDIGAEHHRHHLVA